MHYSATVKYRRTPFTFVLLACLIIQTTGQLGEPVTKDGTVHTTGNGLTQAENNSNKDSERKVWVSDDVTTSYGLTSPSPAVQHVVRIEETFIACVDGGASILEDVTYVNLTQVSLHNSSDLADSDASSCFLFCKASSPSLFISVQAAFGGSTQSCGCHDDFTQTLDQVKQEESVCSTTPGFVKLYCGPSNIDCWNSSLSLRNDLGLTFVALFLLNFIKISLS